MARKILCVAEKPAIAKSVAGHLSGGHLNTVSSLLAILAAQISFLQRNINGNRYVKNYEFDFTFSQPWGPCSVTMTSVLGHLTGLEFQQQYRKWSSCKPGDLFEAAVEETIDDVSIT